MNNAKTNLQNPEQTEGQVATTASTPLATSRMPYTVRALDLDKHRSDVLRIWRGNVPLIPDAKYPWMYEGNPYGPAAGWLLVDSYGEAVGMIALFPRRMYIDGNYRMVAVVGDFVVNRQHRTLGPALMLQMAVVRDRKKCNFDLVYGFPNRQAELVLQRAGYHGVGHTFRMTRPFRSHYYLNRRISSAPLANALAGAVDLIVRWTSKETRHKNNTWLECEVLVDFDERFDDFCERISRERTIVGERNAAYLRWRYARCPYRKYCVHTVLNKSTREVLGYLVWYQVGNSVNIVELCAIEQRGVIDYLLSEFLRYQYCQNIDSVSISYFGSKRLVEKLREYRFAVREMDRKVFVLADRHETWFTLLFSQENWCLFEGDTDG